MTHETLSKAFTPSHTREHVHLVVARQGAGLWTDITLGTPVDEQVVLVPLSMSGPLRPRAGVVVHVPGREQPVPVTRILRSERAFGDGLGLVLSEKIAGLPVETPPTRVPLHEWLSECDHSGVGAYTGALRHAHVSSPENDLPRGWGDWVCRVLKKC